MTATTLLKTTVLKHGAQGPEVVDLQRLLLIVGGVSRGSLGAVDGDFGAKTKSAVLHFQKTRDLVQDGIVESRTWGMLAHDSEWPNQRVGTLGVT